MTKEVSVLKPSFDVEKNKFSFVQSEKSEDGKMLVETYQGPNGEIFHVTANNTLRGEGNWDKTSETLVEMDGTLRTYERFVPECSNFSSFKLEQKPDGTTITTSIAYPAGFPGIIWLEKDRCETITEQSPSGQVRTKIIQYHDQHNQDITEILPDKTKIITIMRGSEKLQETTQTPDGTLKTTKWSSGRDMIDQEREKIFEEEITPAGEKRQIEYKNGKKTREVHVSKNGLGYQEPEGAQAGWTEYFETYETFYADDGKTIVHTKETTPWRSLERFEDKETKTVRGTLIRFSSPAQKASQEDFVLVDGEKKQEHVQEWDSDMRKKQDIVREYTPEGYTELITKGAFNKTKRLFDKNHHILREEIESLSGRTVEEYYPNGVCRFIRKEKETHDHGKVVESSETVKFYTPMGELDWDRSVVNGELTQRSYDTKGNILFQIHQNAEKDTTIRYDSEGKLETITLKKNNGKAKTHSGLIAKLQARSKGEPTKILAPKQATR